MALEFVPLEERHLDAVRRFNQRLVAGKAITPFLMVETAPPARIEKGRPRRLVALEGSEVRGGFLEVIFPATVAGVAGEALNCQSPLSEGLVDQNYLMLPSQMFKVMQRTNPYVFVVGMGGLQNPLPRFLKAAGWSVEAVPFFYKVIRAARFLRHMPVLQRPAWKRAAAHAAAWTGAGAVAVRLMHRGAGVRDAHRWSLEKGEWGPWATELWDRFRGQIRFGVTRDQASLPLLYSGGREIGPLVLKRDGAVCGWTMALLTQMRNSTHFGNLRVATILDCVAEEESRPAAVARTVEYLAQAGADIVVTNQSYAGWQQAFREAGFRTRPSNYILAASPKLTAAIGGKPVESGSIYVTRADGDGRFNL